MKKKKFSKFNIFKSKKGLTYVELLTALALLSLIVVSFTPMLLSSYETIYKAGEITEDVYDSKQEMEKGLARRDATLSLNLGISFNLNTEKLFENINVVGKKIVSSAKESFETAFGIAMAKVKIVSSQRVPDDRSNHDITLQTSGLEYEKVTVGKFPHTIDTQTGKSGLDPKTIHIEIIAPNKNLGGGGAAGGTEGSSGATTDEAVYAGSNPNYCKIKLVGTDKEIDDTNTVKINHKETNGKISINVSSGTSTPLDFTLSPLKVKVYYVNTRGKTATVSTYLFIEAPTLLFAGETKNGIDYFTSAGVETLTEETEKINSKGEKELVKDTTYILRAEGRTMRTENSPVLETYFGSPSNKGVIIRNVSWIDNDETEGLDPYYVMTGTKGAIYRMYNYTSSSTDVYNLSQYLDLTTRKVTDDTNGDAVSYTAGYATAPVQQTVVDKTFELNTGERVYGSLWSGDSTDIFDYSTRGDAMNYGLDEYDDNDNCWLTAAQTTISNKTVNTYKTNSKYHLFGMQATYSYHYNGDRLGFSYKTQKSRTISYILTEYQYPMRSLGHLQYEGNFQGYNMPWHSSYSILGHVEENSDANTIVMFNGQSSWMLGNGDMLNNFNQSNFAQLKITNLGSYNPSCINGNSFMATGDDGDGREGSRKISSGYNLITNGEQSNINLTASIYIPSAGSNSGELVYLGTINAYVHFQQKDNLSTDANKHKNVKNDDDESQGAITEYVAIGSSDGVGTTIWRYNYTKVGTHSGLGNDNGITAQMSQKLDESKNKTGDDRRAFFVSRNNNEWKGSFMNDVNFTFGYSSNRGKVYKEIVYDTDVDKFRSYEPYYYLSHYGVGGTTSNGSPNKTPTGSTVGSATNRNVADNDYYNIWFPGEMYNLTKAVSKDGVTVAVGYAVSGSTYQWINPNQTTNTSTALGGIYNDGVLSVSIEGQNDGALTNLLYFKDNQTMDKDYLTTQYIDTYPNNKEYKDAFGSQGDYGTHDRRSIQFTAVDLVVETMKASETDKTSEIKYYAYYGDNTGRVFRSLVATATGKDAGDSGANVSGLTMVPYIKDLTFSGTAATGASSMEEILVGGKSLNTIFKNIGTIDATDDLVIITGEMADGGEESFVVGVNEIIDEDGNKEWKWRLVKNCGFKSVINDATIVGGYYYIVGNGWMAGVSIDNFRNTAVTELVTGHLDNAGTVDETLPVGKEDYEIGCKSRNQTRLLWVKTDELNIYSIAGRDTQ